MEKNRKKNRSKAPKTIHNKIRDQKKKKERKRIQKIYRRNRNRVARANVIFFVSLSLMEFSSVFIIVSLVVSCGHRWNGGTTCRVSKARRASRRRITSAAAGAAPEALRTRAPARRPPTPTASRSVGLDSIPF